MSQHYLKARTNEGIEVLVTTGWDRPLGYFFLVVEPLDGDHEPLYSNLYDPIGGFNQRDNFDYYQNKLKDMGIELPVEMVTDLNADKASDIGNKVVDWTKV